MARHSLSRLAVLLAAASLEAMLCAGPGAAQTVQMFDEAPSLEQLRNILIPESRGGLARRLEIPRRDVVDGPRLSQPAALTTEAAPSSSGSTLAAPAPGAPRPVPQQSAATASPTATASPAAPASPTAAAAPPQSTPEAVGFRINFALNSTLIPPAYYAYLDKVAELMREEPRIVLQIEGHTDASGSDEYNLTLSQRRAVSVAEYLVSKQSIAPERLRVAGKGKTEPLMDNRYDPRNRRVQFVRAG